MRPLFIIFAILSSFTFAIIGDFDSSGCVDITDLQIFATSWLTDSSGDLDSDNDTDLADFAVFANHWLEGDCPIPPEGGTPPTASNSSPSAVTNIWQSITLSATDDGHPVIPGKMRYIITSLPTVGQIYDPKSGAGKIASVPYTLSSWGNMLSYWTETVGADSLQFKADDCGASPNGQSNTATVTITASANPKDCLTFDGQGYVTIPDGLYLDAVSGWAIDFWIKTRQPYSTLIKKHGASTGYEIKLVGGKPVVEFYDSSSTRLILLAYSNRIDDGRWHELSCNTITAPSNWYAQITVDNDTVDVVTSGSMPGFDNSDPLVIGPAYKGQLDKFRFFSGYDPIINNLAFIQGFSGRTESGNEVIMGSFGIASSVLFMCDETLGTTITDSKTGKVGTFNSSVHVTWLPYFDPFMDVSVQQHYRGR